MEEKTLLNEEQLENVSGGEGGSGPKTGSGTIPADGITYNTYTTTYAGHYYAKNVGASEIVWLYTDAMGWCYCTYETLTIDTNTNTWTATRHSEPSSPEEPFSQLYPYVLNIKP